MLQLDVMDPENMKPWERRMMNEIKELRAINNDVKALQTHLMMKQKEIAVPNFIMSPDMREEALQLMTFAEKY